MSDPARTGVRRTTHHPRDPVAVCRHNRYRSASKSARRAGDQAVLYRGNACRGRACGRGAWRKNSRTSLAWSGHAGTKRLRPGRQHHSASREHRMKSVSRVGPRGDTAGFMKVAVTLVDTGNVRAGFEPGSEWRYSGSGYTIPQLLIEDASGDSFEAFIQRVVLQPLGMVRSSTRRRPERDRDSRPKRLFSPRGGLSAPSWWLG